MSDLGRRIQLGVDDWRSSSSSLVWSGAESRSCGHNLSNLPTAGLHMAVTDFSGSLPDADSLSGISMFRKSENQLEQVDLYLLVHAPKLKEHMVQAGRCPSGCGAGQAVATEFCGQVWLCSCSMRSGKCTTGQKNYMRQGEGNILSSGLLGNQLLPRKEKPEDWSPSTSWWTVC